MRQFGQRQFGQRQFALRQFRDVLPNDAASVAGGGADGAYQRHGTKQRVQRRTRDDEEVLIFLLR
jgi:hypothetical protein